MWPQEGRMRQRRMPQRAPLHPSLFRGAFHPRGPRRHGLIVVLVWFPFLGCLAQPWSRGGAVGVDRTPPPHGLVRPALPVRPLTAVPGASHCPEAATGTPPLRAKRYDGGGSPCGCLPASLPKSGGRVTDPRAAIARARSWSGARGTVEGLT